MPHRGIADLAEECEQAEYDSFESSAENQPNKSDALQIQKGQENDLMVQRSLGHDQERQQGCHGPNAQPEESKSDPREIDYEESKSPAISNRHGSKSSEPHNQAVRAGKKSFPSYPDDSRNFQGHSKRVSAAQ